MPDESLSGAHRTIHGFVDWVEAAKAMAWTLGAVSVVLWAGMTTVLDSRYAKVSDINGFRCEYKLDQISTLEMQLDIIDAKLRRAEAVEHDDKLQLLDERQIISRKVQDMRREVTGNNGCRLEAETHNGAPGV